MTPALADTQDYTRTEIREVSACNRGLFCRCFAFQPVPPEDWIGLHVQIIAEERGLDAIGGARP